MFLTTVEIPDISIDIKSIKQMLDGFDPVSLLPSIDTLVGKVQLVCVIALLAGPLIMTGMGLVYLLFAPKEANYYLGYRCYFGMGSIHSWRFTQRLAGLLFTAAGAIFTVVTLGISAGFGKLEPEAMAWKAVGCLIWQAAAAVVVNLFVSLAAAYFFDRKGAPRRRKKKA